MKNIMQHDGAHTISRSAYIREQALSAWDNACWHIGKAIERAGERAYRLGGRISEGIDATIEDERTHAYAEGVEAGRKDERLALLGAAPVGGAR
jgi:hypothetical protein